MSRSRAVWFGLGALAVAAAVAAAEPTGGGSASPREAATPAKTVRFSFDQADIRVLAGVVGEITGRRYVVTDKVSGTITVVAPAPLTAEEVERLFLSLLESRGFGVVEREGTFFIVPLPEAQGAVMTPPLDRPGVAGEGLVTRIFALQHVEAAEVARTLEPLVRGAKAGGLAVFAPGNRVVVTETRSNLERIAGILAELDRPGSTRTVEVVRLQRGSAEELAQQINAAIAGAEPAAASVGRHIRQVVEGGGALPAGATVIASPAANSLVLVGTAVQIAELKRIIALLDVEPAAGVGRLNAIRLRYLSAEEAAKSLTALLQKSVEKDARQRISIEPSSANNALLVHASPADFQWVRELVESLDTMPCQVLIEILIAETDANRQLDLGVNWSTVELPGRGETVVAGRSRPGPSDPVQEILQRNVFPQGLSVGVAYGAQQGMVIPFLLQALKQDRDTRILSSVPLLVQNNTEASVSVVENIPVLRSTIEGGAGTSRDVIQNIDRMDVGIKLKVTPHVNPNREISLVLNPTIEAVVDTAPGREFAPTIAKREVKTTITVPDRSTVVISGLIREDKGRREHKIPLLGDIPWIGALFRYASDVNRRNNLLVFVTPRIVEQGAEAEAVGNAMERRAGMPGVSDTIRAPAARD
ncbi:MAG: type II secretion system secretin GspD [Kiritimatiellae bacterium]|nr:type II secretion system secretin GspD [Kiritimatiellia bacterium]